MVDLRDKLNVIEQLLATFTSTYAPPRRTPDSGEDLSSSPPSAFVTYIDKLYLIIFFKLIIQIFFNLVLFKFAFFLIVIFILILFKKLITYNIDEIIISLLCR
jgi:hypothetical protein